LLLIGVLQALRQGVAGGEHLLMLLLQLCCLSQDVRLAAE
jgi:hypothetical protein